MKESGPAKRSRAVWRILLQRPGCPPVLDSFATGFGAVSRPLWAAIRLTTFSMLLVGQQRGLAQAPLFLVNPDTEVESLSIRGNETFESSRLKEQIATAAPSLLNRLTFWSDERHPFSPVELQKDVARLRRFYSRHGFLSPSVDYSAQLDTASNRISIVFAVDEGPPLIVQNLDFSTPEGRAAIYQFEEGKEQLRWTQLRGELTNLQVGDRISQFQLSRVQDRILERLTNRGYAFANVRTRTSIDSTNHLVDVDFVVDAGPQAYVDSIAVEGIRSVPREVVIRDLPFEVGDRFEYRKLVRAQRKLFSLDLFRVALVDVIPDQPRDTTVSLRIRIEEAALRYFSAQTGYARDEGINIEGNWAHRNFFGDARRFSLNGRWLTGLAAFTRDDISTGSRQSFSVSLQQPYIAKTRVTAIVAPFYDRRRDLTTEGWEIGVSTTAIYEIHTFRPLSVRHTFARAVPILGTREKIGGDFYNRSIFDASALVGKADSYLQPENGLLVQPFVEFAGAFLRSDVEYVKFGGEATWYRPLTPTLHLTARIFGGGLRPFGATSPQEDSVAAERIDPVQYYAGGSGDVRGWSNRGLGPKDTVLTSDGRIGYEPLGGFSKISGNVDLRIPIGFLGPDWFAGAFLDFAQLGQLDRGLRFRPSSFRYGTGMGIRYRTPAGMVRLDLAFKVNPSAQDLRRAADFARMGADAPAQFRRRFKLHVSIGRSL